MDSNNRINKGIIAAGYGDVCRICLSKSCKMRNVFHSKNEYDNKFIETFYSFTSIMISDNDGMPSLFCKKCEYNLNRTMKFRKQCLESQEILKRCIVNVHEDEKPIGEVPEVLKDNEFDALLKVEIKKENAMHSLEFDNELVHNELEDIVGVLNKENSEDATESEEKLSFSNLGDLNDRDYIDTEDEDNENEDNTFDIEVNCKRKRDKNEQRLRLQQYDPELIKEALQTTQDYLSSKRECKYCGFLASNIRGLRVHIRHLHKKFEGNICLNCYEFVPDLESHQKQCKSTYSCQFCGKNFKCKAHLVEHLRGHTGERPYPCNVCKKRFISDRHLKIHMRTHTGEKPFKCDICNRGFSQKNNLLIHLKASHKQVHEEIVAAKEKAKVEVKPIVEVNGKCKCDECGAEVKDLRSHKRIHASRKNDVLLCTECGKTFKSTSKLRLHMRVHTKEVPYQCSYCEKRFTTRSQMVVHTRVHTKEKPHACTFCGKCFAQPSVLNTHMRLHTGRPEVCTICDRRFCRPTELRQHMRKHTGEKPFLCSVCGNVFAQRSHLKEHLKTHSSERPYQCKHCDRAFKQNSTLKSHILIHTGYKPYQCTLCTYACRQSYSLTQHMKTHNPDAI